MATARQTSQTVCGVATGHAERRGAFIPSQMVLLPVSALYSVSNRPNHPLCPHHLNNSRLELGLEFVWESFNHAKLDAIAPHCTENIRTTSKTGTKENESTMLDEKRSRRIDNFVEISAFETPLRSKTSFSREPAELFKATKVLGKTTILTCRRHLISLYRRYFFLHLQTPSHFRVSPNSLVSHARDSQARIFDSLDSQL